MTKGSSVGAVIVAAAMAGALAAPVAAAEPVSQASTQALQQQLSQQQATRQATEAQRASASASSPVTGWPPEPVVLEGARNFRDIATGMTTADGHVVRPGVVFRSGGLDDLTDADLRTLVDAGVTLDVDLRNAVERADDPDRLPEGVRYQVADVVSLDHGLAFREPLPVTVGRGLIAAGSSGSGSNGTGSTEGGDGSLGSLTDSVGDGSGDGSLDGSLEGSLGSLGVDWHGLGQQLGYSLMVSFEGANAAYHDLLTAIAANDTGATVFHCSGGKDRTGWGSAVLLTILGVPRDQVEQDYLASNAYKGDPDAVELSWLDSAFDTVDAIYGDFDTYVRDGLDIDTDTIDALKARLLE